MYEYGIYNIKTNERNVIFGYSFNDACRRSKKDPTQWNVEYQEYAD